MNLHENVNRIKQVMGLIVEQQSEEDLRKILKDKFPLHNFFGGTVEKQGEVIIHKGFSRTRNGNFVSTYNPTDDFFIVEYMDGSLKGDKIKRWEENGESKAELVGQSETSAKIELMENFPCLDFHYDSIRQTSDGKIVIGIVWGEKSEYVIYFNLNDSTYVIKGGGLDGEQGSFSCNGKEIKWGNVVKSGTTKIVSQKLVPDYFSEVTKTNPITYGMRDHTPEPENGLIYSLQKKLKELNLYTGEPDGQFGPLTLKAVKDFQKTGKDDADKPLVVDGKVGPKTIQSLGLMD